MKSYEIENVLTSNIAINKLSQSESDAIMKDLKKDLDLFRGFLMAFENEKWNRAKRASNWALPQGVRRYYLAAYNEVPYLLVGVNTRVNISSIAKVTRNLYGKGSECLKKLLEVELIPRCTSGVINVRYNIAGDIRVYRLFDKMRDPLPQGVEKIYMDDSSVSIVLDRKASFFES